jgi:hypothetical protein
MGDGICDAAVRIARHDRGIKVLWKNARFVFSAPAKASTRHALKFALWERENLETF